jgi:hypothetical protein
VHPIVGFTRALSGALDRVLVHDPVFLTPEDKQAVLVDLARQRARLDALALKVLAAADRDDVGAESGATSTGAWLAHTTLADRAETAGLVKLARALDEEHPNAAAGLAAGDYSTTHAAVITRALADLPADLDPDLVVRAASGRKCHDRGCLVVVLLVRLQVAHAHAAIRTVMRISVRPVPPHPECLA